MLTPFTIPENDYLNVDTVGYFNCFYTGYRQIDNPDFLNTLKNTFGNTSIIELGRAKEQVRNTLMKDIPTIMKNNNWGQCVCVCIPRAKAIESYMPTQLFFHHAVREAATLLNGVIDGSDSMIRHTNTRTTHLPATTSRITVSGTEEHNDGERPYPGITRETCIIDTNKVHNQNVILIDDVYTSGVNIDEDGIQALLDAGARQVIFYAIAYTGRN